MAYEQIWTLVARPRAVDMEFEKIESGPNNLKSTKVGWKGKEHVG